MNRSKSRELAFKLIYEKEVQKEMRRRRIANIFYVARNRRQ